MEIRRLQPLHIRTDLAFLGQSWYFSQIFMYRGDVLYERSRFNEKISEGDEQRLPAVMESRMGSTIQGDINMKGKLESVPSV